MSNAVANGLAGAGGGIIAQIITYPLQAVNTRQQTERLSKTDKAKKRPGTLLQILQVLKGEGIGGLYSGLKPSLLGTAASQGVYYYFYQIFKNKAENIAAAGKANGRGDGTVGMLSWLIVAAFAGFLNVLFTNPIWVIVTRMQTQNQAQAKILENKKALLADEAYRSSVMDHQGLQNQLTESGIVKATPYGSFQAICDVYNESGVPGFWKGIVPTLIMVCNPSIQFMIYETSLKRLNARHQATKKGNKKPSATEVFLLGALAKLGATVSTYPLLVVKSRLQAKQSIGGNVQFQYSGTLDAVLKMCRYEGLSSFYKGITTKIVQSVFAASLLFMIKEELVKAFTRLLSNTKRMPLK